MVRYFVGSHTELSSRFVAGCVVSPFLQDILFAIRNRMKQLFFVAVLLLVLVYCYAVVSFVFFRNLDIVDISGRSLVRGRVV